MTSIVKPITFLQQPPEYNYAGCIPDIIVSVISPVTFVMSCQGSELISEVITPSPITGRAIISVKDILEKSVENPSPEIRVTAIPKYTYTINGQSYYFYCVKGGNASNIAAKDFFAANFLTWQPQTKPVLYSTPELLRYIAIFDSSIYLKAYFSGGESQTILLLSMSVNNIYTVDVTYSAVRGLFSKQPLYYDVWVEDNNHSKLTWVQRYMLRNSLFETLDCFVFENSLGGYDSVIFRGDRKEMHSVESYTALMGEQTVEYDANITKSFLKYTGYIPDERTRLWILDFFNSINRYHLADNGALTPIYVSKPKLECTRLDVSGYEFTFAYGRTLKYISLPRAEEPELLEIVSPSDELFFLAPRLNEFESINVSIDSDVLIPAQYSYSDKWKALSVKSIISYISNSVLGSSGNKPSFVDLDRRYAKLHDGNDFYGSQRINGNVSIIGFLKIGFAKIRAYIDELARVKISFVGENDSDNVTIQSFRQEAKEIEVQQQISSDKYIPGWAGTGVAIKKDGYGLWSGELDNLSVRRKLEVAEFVKKKVSITGGELMVSNGIEDDVNNDIYNLLTDDNCIITTEAGAILII